MKTTVYIRHEDESLWQDIKNKGQWIHDHLHEEEGTPTDQNIRRIVQAELAELQSQY